MELRKRFWFMKIRISGSTGREIGLLSWFEGGEKEGE